MRSDAVSVFGVLFVCLIAAETAYPADDAHSLAMLGGQMSRDDKVSLEELVAKNPDDVDSRTKLLGYYFLKGRQDADAKTNKQRHIVFSALQKLLESATFQTGPVDGRREGKTNPAVRRQSCLLAHRHGPRNYCRAGSLKYSSTFTLRIDSLRISH